MLIELKDLVHNLAMEISKHRAKFEMLADRLAKEKGQNVKEVGEKLKRKSFYAV